jgi:hypothetical protein
MNIIKFGKFITESDAWSQYHTKGKDYFEDLFYNLLEMDYDLEIETQFGKDTGSEIDHEPNPESGYKPSYKLKFYNESLYCKNFSIGELSIISNLVNEVKAGCKRLEADLGKCYISFDPCRIQISTIDSETIDIEVKNEDLLDFQKKIKSKIRTIGSSVNYNGRFIIKMTEDGVNIDVTNLTPSQRNTLLKHIKKLKDECWHNSFGVAHEDKFMEHFKFDIKLIDKHYIITFDKKIIRYPYRKTEDTTTDK